MTAMCEFHGCARSRTEGQRSADLLQNVEALTYCWSETAIDAGKIVRVGKETDRHWEQGEDPSLVDFKLKEYRRTKLVIADPSDRRRWKKMGVRSLIRKSTLSQKAVYAIITGKPVRKATLAMFRKTVDLPHIKNSDQHDGVPANAGWRV